MGKQIEAMASGSVKWIENLHLIGSVWWGCEWYAKDVEKQDFGFPTGPKPMYCHVCEG